MRRQDTFGIACSHFVFIYSSLAQYNLMSGYVRTVSVTVSLSYVLCFLCVCVGIFHVLTENTFRSNIVLISLTSCFVWLMFEFKICVAIQ